MMKYSPLHAHPQGTDAPTELERYTHHDQGPMGISITYSRHMEAAPIPNETRFHTRGHTYPLSINPVSKLLLKHESKGQPLSSRTQDTAVVKMNNSHLTQTVTQYSWHSSRPVTTQYKHYPPGTVRPSIAPPGLMAVALHRVKPITATTVVRGRKISALPTGIRVPGS